MTKQQKIAEIARATKRICRPEGNGNVIIVYADLSYSEAASANSEIGRGGEEVERRIAVIRTPMSAATVAQVLRRHEAEP